jgi:hypothetical protein
MPWHHDRDDNIICTGGCVQGAVICPVDHAIQPPNRHDENGPYFQCKHCDFLVPDLFGTNAEEGFGKISCPECDGGERGETYDGPCGWCHKRHRKAASRPFPQDIEQYGRREYNNGGLYACDHCYERICSELRTKYARQLSRQARRAKAVAYHQAHEGQPRAACDSCGNHDYCAIFDPENDIFICIHCAPQQTQAPAAGWYNDPEHAGYLRWWSDGEWVGSPVLPEHAIIPSK